MCQLQLFGFLQQILILTNFNKWELIEKILGALKISGSLESLRNKWQQRQPWRKEAGPSRKPFQPEPSIKDQPTRVERNSSQFYLLCASS